MPSGVQYRNRLSLPEWVRTVIPGKSDEEQAWVALRRQVAENAAETSFHDDKRRLVSLETRMGSVAQRLELLVTHYEDLIKAYDRLVTRLEFGPFKTLVFGLCVFMVVVMLIFLAKGGR